MPKIYIAQNPLFHNKVKWVLTIMSQYARVPYEFVSEKSQANITIGTDTGYDILVDIDFFKKLESGNTYWKQVLPDGPIYINDKGEKCIIETIFYLVNCVQEMYPYPEDIDHYGRFKYLASLQFHYGIIERNFVAELIDELIERFPILSSGNGTPKFPAQVFLSHDIDLIHSGWKIEGYLALQRCDWKTLLKVLRDMILGKPFYNNIDYVISLDQKYGFRSCFYWLAAYGKDQNGIMNADYSINDLVEMSNKVAKQGFTNGIHKSSFPTTFIEEMCRFPYKVDHNRYHFLKFQTHQAWREIEAAGLKTDASLGFAEHIGFRNSYGLPFVPFDMENDRPYSFAEIPLHVMDGTLTQYMGLKAEEVGLRMDEFLLKNRLNAVLSILWHNNVLTMYRYHQLEIYYKRLLKRLNSLHLKGISLTDINKRYSIY